MTSFRDLAPKSAHRRPHGVARAAGWALAAALGGQAAPAIAQLRLPSAGLPSLPRQATGPLTSPLTDPLSNALPNLLPNTLQAAGSLQALRLATVRDLLRQHADVLEADPAGEPVRRQEVLLLATQPGTLDAARAEGFTVLREQAWPELDLREWVLRPPPGMGTARAVERLRAIDPQAQVDFNHVYTRSGESAGATAAESPPGASAGTPRRIGLIDSGVDPRHAALRPARLRHWGCGGDVRPSAHGTAVASLLVGRDTGFAGALPASDLYTADIYCDQPAGGAAEDIAQALAWMARERVAVVNISLVGPANRLVAWSVQALLRRGHLIVAAVGNDGPAAPPLYPAAYPGVVGVTGVNSSRRVLPEAAQGPQVMFSAPGADMAVARVDGGYAVARGTSYAAPVVAGLLAEGLQQPDAAVAALVLARLRLAALDLGAPGPDPVFGAGLVGEELRVPPQRLQAPLR